MHNDKCPYYYCGLGPQRHRRSLHPMLSCPSLYRQARKVSARCHSFFSTGISLAFFLGLSLLGCYWLQYDKLMRTHVTLLLAMADKMTDLLESAEPLPPTAMAEFTHPLTRARDFTRIAAKRYETRASLRAFSHFLDTYGAVVQEMDRLRLGTTRDPPSLAHFRQLVKILRQEAQQVTSLLAQEQSTLSSLPPRASQRETAPAPHR